MNIHDATETAYRNGYEQGKKDAVKHGKWKQRLEYYEDIIYRCSVCHEDFETTEETPLQNMWNYCPHCGAKMDK